MVKPTVKIYIPNTTIVAVFRTCDDMQGWIYTGGFTHKVLSYNGTQLPVINPGLYTCVEYQRFGALSGDYGIYGMEYDSPKVHPHVPFPYSAWAVCVTI